MRIDDAARNGEAVRDKRHRGARYAALRSGPLLLYPHASWKGRVLNALGAPLDGGGPLPCGDPACLSTAGADADAARTRRRRRSAPASASWTPSHRSAPGSDRHIRRLGRGQVDAARYARRARGFDTVVIALVGERGREVREFLEDTLGREPRQLGHDRPTGDESAAMRRWRRRLP